MGELITLYHGTDIEALRDIQASGGDLYGMAKSSGEDLMSGNLTDTEWVASQFAMWNTTKGQTERGKRVVITLRIPKEYTRKVGTIPGYGSDGYITTDIVSPDQIPDSYFQRSGIDRFIAVYMVNQGNGCFYKVSSAYQIGIDIY